MCLLRFGYWQILTLVVCCAAGCGKPETSPATENVEKTSANFFVDRELTDTSLTEIETFCGDCHRMPRSSSFPITHWQKEVERGFDFYDLAGRSDLKRPNLYDSIAFFTRNAESEEEFFARTNHSSGEASQSVRFVEDPKIPKSRRQATGHVLFIPPNTADEELVSSDPDSTGSRSGRFIISDMEAGLVRSYDPSQNRLSEVATLKSPVNATACDLNQDGKPDLVVADLGQYKATDAKKGQIVWFKGTESGLEPVTLATGLGRVCQSIVNDFNGDGQMDILVVEFGYVETGGIYLLSSPDNRWSPDTIRRSQIDNRNGCVRAAQYDLDQDGDLDFVAAFAQEHESVEIFVNDGNASFTRKMIFEAGFPSYGSSGLNLVDLDQDGDQDVLYTNGDTFDSSLPKPYHSVQWLENQSDPTKPDGWKFTRHEITRLPGVHCARAADFDNDGDLDIVACGFMSPLPNGINYDAVVYLENIGDDSKPEFRRSVVDAGPLLYPNLTTGDFDGDGKFDFALAVASIVAPGQDVPPIRIFHNGGR